MNQNVIPINRKELLIQANKLIHEHKEYIDGMCVTSVRQEGDVLVFGGQYFLDNNGLPTSKSTVSFNMFKYLSHVFSGKCYLID